MRIRTIKPEFWESETLGRVSREARLLFVGLFSCCDDSGRTRASSRLLASRLFPYDDDALENLPVWLDELVAAKCVRIYVVDGETFLDIPNWLKHQKIDKPSQSKLPEFRVEFEKPREDSRKIALEQGKGTGNRDLLPEAQESAEDHSQRRRDPLFETLATECGYSIQQLNRSTAGMIGTALKLIRESNPAVTPLMISEKAVSYRAKFKDALLTPTALAKHWGGLNGHQPKRSRGDEPLL